MPRVLLQLVSDDNGKIFLTVATPISVHSDANPPHSIGIRTTLKGLSDAELEGWLVVERKDAYKLADQISEKLQEGTASGATEMIRTFNFAGVLNGGVEKQSGRMVLLFSDRHGHKTRLLLPRPESGGAGIRG